MSFFSDVPELQCRDTDYEDVHVLVVGGAVGYHRHVLCWMPIAKTDDLAGLEKG